jgi:hypothetical protein
MKFYEFDETEKKVDIFGERFYPRKIGKELKWYRNVTTILGIIDKGYNFQEWLKNVGHNAEIIVDQAGTFGTDLHKMVELFFKEENVDYSNIQGSEIYKTSLWERFNIWIEWYKESKIVPIATETIVYSDKYEYAGTVDCITKDAIYDWKTGNYVGNQEKLQMVAYMRAHEEMSGVKLAKAYLIHIPKDKPNKKGYKITEVENTDAMFDLFLSTKKIFDLENTDKPKLLTLPLSINIKDI